MVQFLSERTDHSKNEFKSSSSIVIVSIIMHTKSTDALGLLSILALVFNLLSRRNIFIHTVVTINSIVNWVNRFKCCTGCPTKWRKSEVGGGGDTSLFIYFFPSPCVDGRPGGLLWSIGATLRIKREECVASLFFFFYNPPQRVDWISRKVERHHTQLTGEESCTHIQSSSSSLQRERKQSIVRVYDVASRPVLDPRWGGCGWIYPSSDQLMDVERK